MRGKVVAGAAVPLLALVFWAGVKAGERRSSARQAEPAVATLDGQAIGIADLKTAIEEQTTEARSRFSTGEGRRELVRTLIRLELLAREAQRKGYASDPELARQAKRSLVALYLQRELEEPLQRRPVDEGELRAWYAAHRGEYQRPERLRLADLFIEAASGDAAERARAKAAAEAAAVRASEGASAFDDLGLLTHDQLAERLGAPVAVALEPLRRPGTVGPVLETPKGFHVLKLLARENALELRFEDVREAIRKRVLFDRKSRAYQALVEDLEARAHVTVDSALLDSLVVEPIGAPPPATTDPPQASASGAPQALHQP